MICRRPLMTTTALLLLTGMAAAADDLIIEAPEANISESAGSTYVAARLGAAFADDTTFGLDAAAAVPTDIDNAYEAGFVGGIAVGRDYGAIMGVGIRAEIELGYAASEIESHTVTALSATLADDLAFGDTTIFYGLANAALDYSAGAFRPYITGGVGFAQTEFEGHGIVVDAATAAASGLPVGDVVAMDDSDTGVAWQVGVGVGYAITEYTTVEVGYRYFGVSGVELQAIDGTVTDLDIGQHQALFGVRYSF